ALIPKGEITPEVSAALRMVGFRRFEECPEDEFDPCVWRSVTNPHAGEFVADIFEDGRAAELAHGAFPVMPQALPRLLDQIVEAHRALESLSFHYLPTPEPVRDGSAPRQVFVPSVSPYDAYTAIREIIVGAGAWLGIVDPYTDHT